VRRKKPMIATKGRKMVVGDDGGKAYLRGGQR
jgi:hypothetical protein